MDILNEYKELFESGKDYLDEKVKKFIFKDEYLLATCHRGKYF